MAATRRLQMTETEIATETAPQKARAPRKATSTRQTIIIGDVHGCIEELDELVKIVGYRKGFDQLVFVGDLVDRGPDSVGCVRRAQELRAQCALGNHEDKHLRFRKHAARKRADSSYRHPMRFGEQKLQIQKDLSEADWRFLESLQPFVRLDTSGPSANANGNNSPSANADGTSWAVVHAGCEPFLTLADQKKDVILRMRYMEEGTWKMIGAFDDHEGYPFWAERWTGPESLIYGHEAQDAVRIDKPQPNVLCYGIDLGCCFGGSLAALILPEREIVTVKAKRVYHARYKAE